MSEYVYFNGAYSRFDEASVPLTDRGIYFGDGCYDVMLIKDGIPYQLDEHFQRLAGNCEKLGIAFSLTQRRLLSIIHRLCDLSCISTAVIYVQVTRNGGRRRHEFSSPPSESNLLVTVSEYKVPRLRSLKAITLPDRRHTICNVKSLNLLYSVLALHSANEKECDAAIFVRNGIVTEEARSNVFIVKDGELQTHPLDENILPGVVRGKIIGLANLLGIGVTERKFTPSDMLTADEVFISSTTKFLSVISEIDGIQLNGTNTSVSGKLFDALLCDFIERTR